MQVNAEQRHFFHDQGYVLLPARLSPDIVAAIRAEAARLSTQESRARIHEHHRSAVRAIHGGHLVSDLMAQLVRVAPVLEPVRQLLGGEVYLYQFKVNTKAAFVGDAWEWHQDFIFWRHEDLLPTPRLLTAVIFLDAVTEFNGPLVLIPGSHREGMIPVMPRAENPPGYEHQPDWVANFTARLKYGLSPDIVRRVAAERGLVAPKGPPGSLLLLDPNLVHASGTNISPDDRYLCLLTYSHIDNLPQRREHQRPEFLVSRDFSPLSPLPVSDLLTLRTTAQEG